MTDYTANVSSTWRPSDACSPPFDPATLREVARILGDTKSGLSNRELDDILHEAGIDDPSPKSQTPHTYVAISKRDRLFAAIEARQGHDRAANAVLKLIECAMHPVRYRDNSAVFEERRDELNVALAFAGLMLPRRESRAPLRSRHDLG